MAAITLILHWLSTFNVKLALLFRLLAWVFLALMTLFIVTQVIFRYGFNNSLFWPEDVSLMMMIWVAFAVAPIAYRTGANVSLDMFMRALGRRAFYGLCLLIHVLILIMLFYLINEALAMIGRSKIRANSIPVPMKYIYIIMPVSFAAMIAVGVELGLRCGVGIVRPDDPAARLPSAVSETDSVAQA